MCATACVRRSEDHLEETPPSTPVDPSGDTGHQAWQRVPWLNRLSSSHLLAPQVVDWSVKQISQLSVIRAFDAACCIKCLIVD